MSIGVLSLHVYVITCCLVTTEARRLRLEFQTVRAIWVLGLEARSSTRAEPALHPQRKVSKSSPKLSDRLDISRQLGLCISPLPSRVGIA